MNKEQALRTIKLLSALEAYAFMIEKFMPDYLHDELITIVSDLESIVLDKTIENSVAHVVTELMNAGWKQNEKNKT